MKFQPRGNIYDKPKRRRINFLNLFIWTFSIILMVGLALIVALPVILWMQPDHSWGVVGANTFVCFGLFAFAWRHGLKEVLRYGHPLWTMAHILVPLAVSLSVELYMILFLCFSVIGS